MVVLLAYYLDGQFEKYTQSDGHLIIESPNICLSFSSPPHIVIAAAVVVFVLGQHST